MKNKIFRLVFILWVIIWVFFTLREIFVKGNLRDYKILLCRSLEGKRAYVTGDRFYEFIRFCNDKLPGRATYRWVKTDKPDLSRRRATYYLYPHLEAEDAQFLLVYDEHDVPKDSYEAFTTLDDGRYMLKKREGRVNWIP